MQITEKDYMILKEYDTGDIVSEYNEKNILIDYINKKIEFELEKIKFYKYKFGFVLKSGPYNEIIIDFSRSGLYPDTTAMIGLKESEIHNFYSDSELFTAFFKGASMLEKFRIEKLI